MASDQPTAVAVLNEQQVVRWWWPLGIHRRRIMLGALPVAGIAALWLVLIDPDFVSHALIEVEGADTDRSAGAESDLRVMMGTQREIVTSSTVAGALRESFIVEALPDTHLLAIHYHAPDPLLARDGANGVAQAYVEYTANTQLAAIEAAASLMVRKLEGVRNAASTVYNIQHSERLKGGDQGQNSERLQSTFQGAQHDPSDIDGPVTGLLEMVSPIYPGARELDRMQMADLAGGELVSNLVEMSLVRQVVESYDASVTHLVSAKIVDPASLPLEPEARRYSLLILLSYLGAVVVFAGVLVVRFQWRNTVDLPQDVRRTLRLDCLGTVPLMAEVPKAGCSDQGAFAAAIRALSTELRLLRPAGNVLEQFQKGRIILVTSGHAGEGKSTVAGNLAAAMGRVERVLLIDADMRGARSCFGIAMGAPGLSHLIAGAAQMRECIHRSADNNIDVIPTGVLPPNPQELLASKRLQRILDVLERRYDTIIIDSPALVDVSDTLSLARRCSDLLYVVAAGRTRVNNAREQLARLTASGAPIARIVLNRFSTPIHGATVNLNEMELAYESR